MTKLMIRILAIIIFLLCITHLEAQTTVYINSDIPASVSVDYREISCTPCAIVIPRNTYMQVSIRDINNGSWSGRLYSGLTGPKEVNLEYCSKTFRVTRSYPNMVIQRYYYPSYYYYDRPLMRPLHHTPRIIPWRQFRHYRGHRR